VGRLVAPDRELEGEVLRHVELSRGLSSSALVNRLRNRWAKRLGDAFEARVKGTIRALIERGELVVNAKRELRRVKVKPKGIISFSLTLDAFLAGVKTVTRRAWKAHYAARFRQGDILYAYDRRPDFGGKPVALIRLTQTPHRQSTAKTPDRDWFGEGFDYLQKRGKKVNGLTPREFWARWKEKPEDLWVVRFEVLEYL